MKNLLLVAMLFFAGCGETKEFRQRMDEAKAENKRLNEAYDEYVKEYGPVYGK